LDICAHPFEYILYQIDHVLANGYLWDFNFFISAQKLSSLCDFGFLNYTFETRREVNQPWENLDDYTLIKGKRG